MGLAALAASPILPITRASASLFAGRVGLGSWITFNVGDDPVLLKRSQDVIAAFAEAGGGLLDSSPMYGSSQDTIGRALEALGHPAAIASADKVWTGDIGEGPEQIATSMARWGVRRFDILQIHNLVGWEGHLEKLAAMKADGRIGSIGITTSHGRRHDEFEKVMALDAIDTVQLTYNAVDREAERRLLPLARERGLRVIVNRPFQRGALTRRVAGVPLPGYAAELGAEGWAELLLKFVLSHPAGPEPIPATTSVAHLRQNKRAETGAMPDAALRQRIAADVAAA